ncbi:MAG: hypothetical protein QOD02_3497 [Mycobacterium sp.]|jgi:hypothetical protein|nr:hypothetical protein [Mycobacterium sp.]
MLLENKNAVVYGAADTLIGIYVNQPEWPARICLA